ncbi:DUF2500 domain-containing protein [Domibacillus indicus]|uniref:DUF2500 domain-containing protein n=1 Tax=Domibacillus indicus TaxID=1437523 RepID=UPI000617D5B4|nr:DUF2500 domain-containing protein [Domibacillus indicus]
MVSLWSDGFGFAPLFITTIFLIVIGTILVAGLKGLMEWNRNNEAPEEIIQAVVTGKRTEISGGSGDSAARTRYFVTYEDEETGGRIELKVSGKTYGMTAEGDRGELVYQGTRYKEFKRLSE